MLYMSYSASVTAATSCSQPGAWLAWLAWVMLQNGQGMWSCARRPLVTARRGLIACQGFATCIFYSHYWRVSTLI